MNYLSEFFGFIALIFYLTSLLMKKKKAITKNQIISNSFYVLQYLVLHAYDATLTCIIGLSRSAIVYKYSLHRKNPPKSILYTIITITAILGIIAYKDIFSLIPFFTSMGFTYFIWQKKLNKFRVFCVVNAILWIIYNVRVHAMFATVSSVIELLFASFSIYLYNIKKVNKPRI